MLTGVRRTALDFQSGKVMVSGLGIESRLGFRIELRPLGGVLRGRILVGGEGSYQSSSSSGRGTRETLGPGPTRAWCLGRLVVQTRA